MNEVNVRDDQQNIKDACEARLFEGCLRDDKRFLLRLLEQKRTGAKNNLLFDFFSRRSTKIPDEVSGSLSKVAQDMVRIVLQTTASKRKVILGSSWFKKLDDFLYDQWGYNHCVVQTLHKDEIKGKMYGLIDIASAIGDWAKTHGKKLGVDASLMERKVGDVILQTKSFCNDDSDGYFIRRCDVLYELLDFDRDVSFSKSSLYRITCPEKNRLTVDRLTHNDGLAGIVKESVHLDHLAEWKIIKADRAWSIMPKVINLEMTGLVSKGISSLQLGKVNANGEWVFFKHKKEDRYAIINVSYDSPLSCNNETPLAVDLECHCGEKNNIGFWLVNRP